MPEQGEYAAGVVRGAMEPSCPGESSHVRIALFSLIAAAAIIMTAAMILASGLPAYALTSTGGATRLHDPAATGIVPPAILTKTILLADMTEERDQIRYGAGPNDQKTAQDLAAEEKQKEERAWQMLERTQIYPSAPYRPYPPRPPADNARQRQ